jgi:hypothetical protein
VLDWLSSSMGALIGITVIRVLDKVWRRRQRSGTVLSE